MIEFQTKLKSMAIEITNFLDEYESEKMPLRLMIFDQKY